VKVPEEVNVWNLKSPLVVSVPPVAATNRANVTLLEAAEGADVPIALVAVTVNVYMVGLSSPLTATGEDAPVPVIDPGLEVAVYPVIADPPLSEGAVKATVADVVPVAVAVPIVGAPGTVLGIGHKPAATFCMACSCVHIPDATPLLPPVVVGGVLLMMPPMYLLDMADL
jgi:hypothetical protein